MLGLWRAIDGSKANANSFIGLIKEKPETKFIREQLDNALYIENKDEKKEEGNLLEDIHNI